MRPDGQFPDTRIIDFYSGNAPDDQGRYLTQIQKWSDQRLEAAHDFIQWMFPLKEHSAVNPEAPVLNANTIREFRSRPDLQQNLRASLLRLLSFYGMEIRPGPVLKIERAANFAAQAANWLAPGNHNHLRITRIIKCLRLLGLKEESRVFFDCLSGIYAEESERQRCAISRETFQFWQSAAHNPL